MAVLNRESFDDDNTGNAWSWASLGRYICSDILVSLLRLAPSVLLLLISHDLLAFYNPNRWFPDWQQLMFSPEWAFWLLFGGVPTLLWAAGFFAPIFDRWRSAYELAGRIELPQVERDRDVLRSKLERTRRELVNTEDQLKGESITCERTLDRLTAVQKELDATKTKASRAEAELLNTKRMLEETGTRLIKSEQLLQSAESRKNQEIVIALQEADAQLQTRIKQVSEKVRSSDGKAPVQTSFPVNDTALTRAKSDQPTPSSPKDIFL